MSQTNLNLPITFESLLTCLATLSHEEKQEVRDWLSQQIAKNRPQETHTDYSVKDDLTIDRQTTPQHILVLFKELSMADRVNIAEAILHLVQQDLKQISYSPHLSKSRRQQQLAIAAQTLLPDYQTDDELTSFTVLDGEAFHEAG